MKSIEIYIRCGNRSTSEDGQVTWTEFKDASGLVSYLNNHESAKKESLRQAKRMLDQIFRAEIIFFDDGK